MTFNLCFFTKPSPGFPIFRREWSVVPRVGDIMRVKECAHEPWKITRVEWYDGGLVHLMLEKEYVDGWRK